MKTNSTDSLPDYIRANVAAADLARKHASELRSLGVVGEDQAYIYYDTHEDLERAHFDEYEATMSAHADLKESFRETYVRFFCRHESWR